jgi:D-sedoheptulose 7-phosphate isomerase
MEPPVSGRSKGEEALAQLLAEAAEALHGVDTGTVARAVDALLKVQGRGGVIYTAGNGGSAATASHLALDLQKAAGVRALSLSDNPGLITAWGNDTSFDRVFAEQLEVLGREEDGVIVISVSGSSPNLIALLDVAREKGMTSVGLLGCDGGRAAPLVDVSVVVPSGDYGWVESVHSVLHHALTYALRDATAGAHAPRDA